MQTAAISTNQPSANALWEQIKIQLSKQLGSATFKSWFMPLQCVAFEAGVLRLSAPTKFIADWIEGHYVAKIKAVSPVKLVDIKIVVIRPTELQTLAIAAEKAALVPAPETAGVVDFAEYNSSISSRIDPRFRFDNFVVAQSNRLAQAAALRVAQMGADSGFNPLFLQSGVGLGKTHLMHAIANYCAEKSPEKKVIYLSAEKFLHSFIRSLRDKKALEFKEELRSADILMIDDFQFICGKKSTQEEFFHTFDALVDDGKQLVISCDRCPSEFENLPERLRSRLGSGLVADIAAADYELRLQILQKKTQQSGQVVADDVLQFLADKIASNVRELEGALNRVTARAQLVGAEISIATTTEFLADLLKISPKKLSVDAIVTKVAVHYGISEAQLMSKSRAQQIANARQVAIFLAKKLTQKSYPEIGRMFAGRDHSTIIHSCKKVESLMLISSSFSAEIEALQASLKQL